MTDHQAERREITVVLPKALIGQLDTLRAELGKSRSWVIEQLVQIASWESLVEAVEEGEVE